MFLSKKYIYSLSIVRNIQEIGNSAQAVRIFFFEFAFLLSSWINFFGSFFHIKVILSFTKYYKKSDIFPILLYINTPEIASVYRVI